MSKPARIVGRDPATGQGIAVDCRDGRIVSIDAAVVDETAPFLSAGFVDLQVNGYAGHGARARSWRR